MAANNAGNIVFYYNFPAGYLFSTLKPAANAIWLFSPRDYPRVNTRQLERYYANSANQPDIVVKFQYFFGFNDELRPVVDVPDHPIERLLASGQYHVELSQREYVVYRKD